MALTSVIVTNTAANPVNVKVVEGKNGWAASGNVSVGGPKLQAQIVFSSPGYHTVKFGIKLATANSLPSTPFDLYAIVEWSTAGNTIYRKVSLVDGVAISGNAEAVKISVGANGVSGVALVTMTMTPGVRPSVDQPPTCRFEATSDTVIDVDGVLTLSPAIPRTSYIVPIDHTVGAMSFRCPAAWGNLNQPGFYLTPEVRTGYIYINQRDSRVGTGFLISAHDLAAERGFIPIHPNTQKLEFYMSPAAVAAAQNYFLAPMWGIDG